MSLSVNESLITEFLSVLDSPAPQGRQKEQVVQDFLENHSELIPTPNLLNHHLHFEAVVSKYPLSTEFTTDYIYITKSSDVWRITLVELEKPEKDIYTSDQKRPNNTADFNAALNQVRSWKNFIDENKSEVVRKLEPLLRPIGMQRNPVEFCYQLIIGRSANKNASEGRKKHFRSIINETGIEILTYDTLLNWYRNNQRFEKNILKLSGIQFAFKLMHFSPTQILSYVGPDYLMLTDEQMEKLSKDGYQMEKWSKGELLTYNIKYSEAMWENRLKKGELFDPLKS